MLPGVAVSRDDPSVEVLCRYLQHHVLELTKLLQALPPQLPLSGCILDLLTKREMDVALLAHLPNHMIQRRLMLSESSVKNYVHRILVKLSLKNRHQLVRIVQQVEERRSTAAG